MQHLGVKKNQATKIISFSCFGSLEKELGCICSHKRLKCPLINLNCRQYFLGSSYHSVISIIVTSSSSFFVSDPFASRMHPYAQSQILVLSIFSQKLNVSIYLILYNNYAEAWSFLNMTTSASSWLHDFSFSIARLLRADIFFYIKNFSRINCHTIIIFSIEVYLSIVIKIYTQLFSCTCHRYAFWCTFRCP